MLLVMCLGLGGLAARAGQVQVLAADRYARVGESQRVRAIKLPAERGSIFDREGRDLALSMPQRTVWANPRLVSDPLRTAETLAPLLGLDAAELQSRLTRDAAFVYVARKVSDEIASRVEALKLDGVFFIDEPQRFLPAGALASPVIGRVGLDNEGLSGLESQYERVLQGKAGNKLVEHDPHGREIPGGVRAFLPPVPGDDLVLTIDRSLQYETERALANEIVTANARGGMAVVMQVQTGEILALANFTTDPADGTVAASSNNMALTNVYEPGSVSKMITVSGALEEGLVKPSDTWTVGNKIQVADHLFGEAHDHAVKPMSVTDIVANSSNIGTIGIGLRLGKERLDHYQRQFGFGSRTGIGFPGESAGLLLPPKKWSGTTIATVSIGQGIAVTALQMLAAYNTIANGGVYIAPKLVRGIVGADGVQRDTPPAARRRAISSRTAAEMTGMLEEVVRVGTGQLAAIDGYTVVGKTGTARKWAARSHGYQDGAYVSSFAGFVPGERPALSAIVVLDQPTPIYGSVVAAPVFAQIMRYGLREFRIPPPPPSARPAVPRVSTDEAAHDVGDAGGNAPPTSR
jgi:cell division protein FtsI/penicillin-binding protein 2